MATANAKLERAKVVSSEEWLEARKALLEKEKVLTRLRDELSRDRREMPWERVEKAYEFEGSTGKLRLADLFGKQSQLIIYHFMLGPGWKEGCQSCSFLGDHFDGMTIHLANRDVRLVAVSRAPIAEIEAYKKRMGWKFDWVSSFDSDFNYDYQVSNRDEEKGKKEVYYNYRMNEFPGDERPGASVFIKEASGEVFHTYSAYSRGLDILLGAYNFIDLTPKGRDEEGLPWPMAWVRHHDQYAESYAIRSCCSHEAK